MVKRRRRKSKYSKSLTTGRDGLHHLDDAVTAARQALRDAQESADEAARRRAEVRQEQIQAYRELADVRLDLIRSSYDPDDLSAIDRKASELIAAHGDFVAAERAEMERLGKTIEALEDDRDRYADGLDDAITAHGEHVDALLEALSGDERYRDLSATLEKAASVAERAEQKLDLARMDRKEKGAPYDADPLFRYLWQRKYRTPTYRALPPFRLLDGWVARLCGYDKAHLNYARLVELPERLAEHVEHVAALEAKARAELEATEAEALKVGGADAFATAVETARTALQKVDADLEEAESAHLAKARAHEDALHAHTGPAEEARCVLQNELRKASFPDLRVIAAQTVALEDDAIVDRLVKLRAEDMQLDLEAERTDSRPARRRDDLHRLEALRTGFKRRGYDSHGILLDSVALDDIIASVQAQHMDVEDALARLSRQLRRRHTRRHRYRSGRRYRGGGDHLTGIILADVAWEIAKGAMNSGRYTGDVGIDIDFDDWGGSGGGFKTGGKF